MATGSRVSGRSATAPHASARTYPSARASKVWQLPPREVIPATAHCALTPASKTMLTPATSAVAHSACCSPRIPACSAARLLEHACHACASTIS
eukprot:scaffold80720_cov71-Phaeocystis_antarctica.AAC.17